MDQIPLVTGTHRFQNGLRVEVEPDAVYVLDGDDDDKDEIVSWIIDEWIEDPSVTISIVNLVLYGALHGPEALRRTIGK